MLSFSFISSSLWQGSSVTIDSTHRATSPGLPSQKSESVSIPSDGDLSVDPCSDSERSCKNLL